MICVNKCPAKAISKDESVSVEIKGEKFTYAKLNEEKCGVGFQCGSEETNPFLWDGSENAELTRFMMKTIYNDDAEYLRQRQIHGLWANYEFIYEKHAPSKVAVANFKHPTAMCGATCQRECMIHLEQQDKLENKFHTKFRIRQPWRLDTKKLLDDLYGEKGTDNNSDDHKLTDYTPKK
jgi:ferredoxin